jgi:hypothetical protein
MGLYLEDSSFNTYGFPETFTAKNLNWKQKISISDIAFKNGAADTGDNKIGGRSIPIEGIISGVDATDYRSKVDELYFWLTKKNLKLYFTAGRYINIKAFSNISCQFMEGTFERVSRISCNAELIDPFWYYTTPQSVETIISASPQTIAITNSSNYEIYPVISIGNAADNIDFTLENDTDDSAQFRYTDTNFLNGDTLVIDTAEGTVKKNGLNAIDGFNGLFLKLLVGSNSFIYTGAIGTVTFDYYNIAL